VVIHYLYVIGISAFPNKADPPLIIYSYAMLPGSFSLQLLKPIGWWDPQRFQLTGGS
jgi:hypothetical protein